MPNIHRFSESILAAESFLENVAVPGAVGAGGASVDVYANGGPFRRAAAYFDAAPTSTTTIDCKLQEAANNSTWTDVTGGAFTTAGSATHTIQLMDIDLATRKRYLRLYYTNGGAATGYAAGAIFLYEPANAAPTQTQTAIHV